MPNGANPESDQEWAHGDWLAGLASRKRLAAESLLDVVLDSEDPDIRVKAMATLIRADLADRKREEVALKKQEADERRRLRLLEFVRSLPPGTVAQIASEHKASAAGGLSTD